MRRLLQDIRYGARVLLKSPGFTAVAVLTLALGIGANTAIFSVVNAVLLSALPYKDAERLVILRETVGKDGWGAVAYPNFLDWKAQGTTFEDMAAYTESALNLSGQAKAERVSGELVTPNYFSLLGVSAAQGRAFLPEEDDAARPAQVAVLSHGLWQRRFGGDAAVVGKTVRLNDATFTVVGVMPEGFKGYTGNAEVWLPFGDWDVVTPQTAKFHFLSNRGIHWHRVLGRLKPDVTLEAARAEMATIGARLAEAYPAPNENRDRGADVVSARESVLGDLRTPLLVLLGGVGFVLLIACANVANLLLARATSREREIAIRRALGAGRRRVVRQLLTESSLIAFVGGALGLLVALWSFTLLKNVLPLSLPNFVDVQLDYKVLAFTLGVSALTGLVLGLAPASQATKVNLFPVLKEGGSQKGGTGGGRHLRRALIVSEIALSLVLLVSAGLMLKSFRRLQSVDLGFRPENLLLLRFDVPNLKYQGAERARVGQRIAERVETLPGVESAAVNYTDLLRWSGISFGFTLEGRDPVPPAEQASVVNQSVTPKYFRTLGIPLLAGRDFAPADDAGAPRVAIVSESFARRYWPDGDVLGKRFRNGPPNAKDAPWITVVGVAGNIRVDSIFQEPTTTPIVYTPSLQDQVVISLSLLVRTRVEPSSLIPTLREEMNRFDSDIPVYNIMTAAERVGEQTARTRSYTLLIGLFASLALLLAAVGIYGVMSYLVGQRTREIGIRIALGAQGRDVLRMVVGEGARLALVGVAIGLPAAYAATRLMAGLLYGVSAADPVTFVAIPLGLVAVALLACYVPARRATKVDPMVALRYE
ncbi:MAG: ABC transporter permease [Acidobacteria bacterium]|nr:ABC transporter permease [Acidobacteriota bacterium]